MDDGVTENNYAHNNTIYDAEFGIMAFRSPFNTMANNIMDDIESYEYYVSRDSDLQIHNQTFSDDRIKREHEQQSHRDHQFRSHFSRRRRSGNKH
jgi:hypothetical protein